MEFGSIVSGSSGNCIYIGNDSTHILIDSGISGKKIEKGLAEYGVSANDLDAILVTHEHIDHIAGLGVMARRYGIPIYATGATIDAITSCSSVGKIDADLFNEVGRDKTFSIGSFNAAAIGISHDAADPVAYRIEDGTGAAAVMTDLGYYDEHIANALKGLDVLLLEANHDIRMLETGPYPYQLKQRILGKKGHLSNENAGRLLCDLLHPGLKKVFLGHLSNENNYPELAYETVRLEIDLADIEYSAGDFDISVASRHEATALFRF